MTLRDTLRRLPSLSGPFTQFNVDAASETPQAQFISWLEDAIAAGIREPHAMTLSSVDADGHPDARTLILKDLDARGWHFATSGLSPKGQQIALHDHVALTFYWPALGRQVRIRGVARHLGAEVSSADFLARAPGAKAGALSQRQSQVLGDLSDLAPELARQQQRLADYPDLVAPDWSVYAVAPEQVEFWQADVERHHTRLRYSSTGHGWERRSLWP